MKSIEQMIKASTSPVAQVASGNGTVYANALMDEGQTGSITYHKLFDGVYLQFNSFPKGRFSWNQPPMQVLSIEWCERGRCEVMCTNGKEYYIDAGDFAVHDHRASPQAMTFPQTLYRGFTIGIAYSQGCDSVRAYSNLLGLDFDILKRNLFEPEGCKVFKAQSPLMQVFSSFYSEQGKNTLACWRLSLLKALCLMDESNLENFRSFAYSPRSAKMLVDKAKHYLESDLSQDVSLAEAAAFVGVSPSTLKQRFTKALGVSPMKYRRECKLEYAASLLEASPLAVAQVANAVGYQNPSKFSAIFKQKFGCTPSEYRAGRQR